jgi:hypothetical protein
MRVTVDGKPVILRHASVHQICLTRNYLVIFNANLVLNTASLIEPLTPLLWRFLVEQRTEEVPYNLRVFYRWLRIRMREATPEQRCPVYFIHKDDIRKALRGKARDVPARKIELHWELTHALADYDDDGDIVTLFCQHNIGADPADQMEDGDRLVGGGTVPADLLGMFSSATDLNQVRRHVVDLRRGRVETRAFPEVGDPEHFAFGLNLLPPLQLNPYLSEYGDSARAEPAARVSADGRDLLGRRRLAAADDEHARVLELPPRPPRRRVAAAAAVAGRRVHRARRTPTTRPGSSA